MSYRRTGMGQDLVEYSKGGPVRYSKGGPVRSFVHLTSGERALYPGPGYRTVSGNMSYPLVRSVSGIDDPSLMPAPRKPLSVAAIVGWAAVVAVGAGVFWAVTTGKGLGRNPRRRVRRNGARRYDPLIGVQAESFGPGVEVHLREHGPREGYEVVTGGSSGSWRTVKRFPATAKGEKAAQELAERTAAARMATNPRRRRRVRHNARKRVEWHPGDRVKFAASPADEEQGFMARPARTGTVLRAGSGNMVVVRIHRSESEGGDFETQYHRLDLKRE